MPYFPRGAKRVSECGFDCVSRLEAICSQQHIPQGNLRIGLQKPNPTLAHERHRLLRRSEGSAGIAIFDIRAGETTDYLRLEVEARMRLTDDRPRARERGDDLRV